MNEQHVVLRNTVIHAVGRTLSIIVGVATIAIVTRLLGPYGFGIYTTAMSYLQLFGILMDAGLTLAVSQLLGGTPERDHARLFSNAMTLRVLMSAAALTLALGFIPLLRYEPLVVDSVAVGSFIFALYALQQLFTVFFQFHRLSSIIVVAELTGRVVTLVACIAIWLAGGGVLMVIGAFLLGTFATVMMMGSRSLTILAWTFSWNVPFIRRVLSTAWPIGLSIAFNLIYFKADAVILSIFYPAEVVGIYGAPYKILEVLIAFPPIMLGLLLPKLSASWTRHDQTAFRQWFQWGWELTMLVGLPLTVGGIIVATPLMEFVAGSAFRASGPLLAILLVATFLIYCSSLFGYSVVAIGKQRAMIAGYALTAVLALAGYFRTIPLYGAWAAAWMTVAAEATIAIFTLAAIRHEIRLSSLGSPAVGRTLLATGAMAVTLMALDNTTSALLTIAVGATIYASTFILMGGHVGPMIRTLSQ